MTHDEAIDLAMRTNYAHDASEQDDNPINEADAGAFFLEGYLHAEKLFTEERNRIHNEVIVLRINNNRLQESLAAALDQ